MKIAGLVVWDEGTFRPVPFYRLIQPLTALSRLPGFDVQLHRMTEQGLTDLAWMELADRYDLLVMQRSEFGTAKEAYAFRRMLTKAGCRLVIDLDDALTAHQRTTAHLATLAIADLVTVSTDALARQVRPINPRVRVLPNSVDPAMFQVSSTWTRPVAGLTVGVQGGLSHHKDWRILADVWPVLAERFPDVTFVVAGDQPSYFDRLGDRLVRLPFVPFDRFPETLAAIDIHCAPLTDSAFNRCKSPLKFFDAAMMGKPCVCSPTVYADYQFRWNAGPRIARTPEEWIQMLGDLIANPGLRRGVGERDRAYVLEFWGVDRTVGLWADAYRSIVRERVEVA